MCVVGMDVFGDVDDISWLTQSDGNAPNFDITGNFLDRNLDLPVVSLEENVIPNSQSDGGAVEIYDGVFAEAISDDEAIDSL